MDNLPELVVEFQAQRRTRGPEVVVLPTARDAAQFSENPENRNVPLDRVPIRRTGAADPAGKRKEDVAVKGKRIGERLRDLVAAPAVERAARRVRLPVLFGNRLARPLEIIQAEERRVNENAERLLKIQNLIDDLNAHILARVRPAEKAALVLILQEQIILHELFARRVGERARRIPRYRAKGRFLNGRLLEIDVVRNADDPKAELLRRRVRTRHRIPVLPDDLGKTPLSERHDD